MEFQGRPMTNASIQSTIQNNYSVEGSTWDFAYSGLADERTMGASTRAPILTSYGFRFNEFAPVDDDGVGTEGRAARPPTVGAALGAVSESALKQWIGRWFRGRR